MSDLPCSNDAAIKGVDGRIGNRTRCNWECCIPMETSIEGACYQEIPENLQGKISMYIVFGRL